AEQRRQSFGRHLSRYLRDANRTTQLIGGFPSGDDTADIRERALDYEPSPLHAELHRLERADRLEMRIVRRRRTSDAELALTDDVAEAILDLFQRRGRLEGHARAATLDLEHERLAGAGADDLLHVREAVDRLAVDAQHQIARLEAGGGR